MVDTVVLGVEVAPERQAEVGAFLQRTFCIPLLKDDRRGAYARQGMAGLTHAGEPVRFALAWWAPFRGREEARWLRLQLAPRCEAHCRLLRRLLRLASTWGPNGDTLLRARVFVAQFDVALDYPVRPSWLVLQRPLAKNFRRVQDEEGAITWYAGSRDGEVYVRVYDYAARHIVPGPLTRVEAAVKPSPQPELQLVEARVEDDDPLRRVNVVPGLRDPFRNIALGALHAADLDFAETALVAQAREVGIAWARRQLAANPVDLARLDAALAKVSAGPMLHAPSHWLAAAWVPLIEDLKLRLLYGEDEDGEGVHWSWQGAEFEDLDGGP